MKEDSSLSPDSLSLKHQVNHALKKYFSHLEGAPAANLYHLVLEQVEEPLIKLVMQYAEGNQSKAAEWLGISRNTLIKFLKQYKLLSKK